jgi:ABC-type nitrate/sulfonate/bicarbonate transport system permease component
LLGVGNAAVMTVAAIAGFFNLIFESKLGFGDRRESKGISTAARFGLAAAAGATWSAALASKMYISPNGLGSALKAADDMSAPPILFSALVIAAALGGGIGWLAGLADRAAARHMAAAGMRDLNRPRSMMRAFTWQAVALGAAIPILILLVWWVATRDAGPFRIVPSPSETAETLWVEGGPLMSSAASTIWQLVLALLLSTLLALAVTRAMRAQPRMEPWLRSSILMLGAVPPVMWVWVFPHWLGFGASASVLAATTGASLSVLIDLLPSRTGGIGQDGSDLVTRPRDLPAGARRAVKIAFGIVLLSGMIFGPSGGLGRLVAQTAIGFDSDLLFACLLTIAVIGLVVETVTALACRHLAGARSMESQKSGDSVRL